MRLRSLATRRRLQRVYRLSISLLPPIFSRYGLRRKEKMLFMFRREIWTCSFVIVLKTAYSAVLLYIEFEINETRVYKVI